MALYPETDRQEECRCSDDHVNAKQAQVWTTAEFRSESIKKLEISPLLPRQSTRLTKRDPLNKGGFLERQRVSGFSEPTHNSLHFQQRSSFFRNSFSKLTGDWFDARFHPWSCNQESRSTPDYTQTVNPLEELHTNSNREPGTSSCLHPLCSISGPATYKKMVIICFRCLRVQKTGYRQHLWAHKGTRMS